MKSIKKGMLLLLPVYTVVWVIFLYIFSQIIVFMLSGSADLLIIGMAFINFGVHEVSHIATFFLPNLAVALAGSVGEISFTLLLLIAALKAKSYAAACFTGLWVMLAFISVGRYVSDARAQALQLMGPSETVIHDWNYILSELNLLQYDQLIGGALQYHGVLIGLVSVVLAGFLLYKKATR